MDITITTMTTQDINQIAENFSKNFDKFWSIAILQSDFASSNSTYIVAKIQNTIVGFAGIKVILDEADIMNIAVRTDKRSLGIGSLLLEKLITTAQNLACQTITLEVNETNAPAIRLYEKYHFTRIGLRKKYYNNTNDAILMQRDLGGETNEKEK